MEIRRALLVIPVLASLTACTALLGVKDVPDPTADGGGGITPQGDSGGMTPPPPGPVPEGGAPNPDVQAALATYAYTGCKHLQSCTPAYFEFSYASLDECVTSVIASANLQLSFPGATADKAFFDTCTMNTAALTCSQVGTVAANAACVAKGTRPVGDGCEINAQCVTGLCNAQPLSCGACVEVPPAGASCVSGPCGPDFVCDQNFQCVKPATAGGSCTDAPCNEHSLCIGGKCEALPATAGQQCLFGPNGGRCDTYAGLFCNGSSECAKYVTHGASEECGNALNPPADCRRAAVCQSSACAPPPGEGGGCDASLGPACLAPLLCIHGTCTKIAPSGSCP